MKEEESAECLWERRCEQGTAEGSDRRAELGGDHRGHRAKLGEGRQVSR